MYYYSAKIMYNNLLLKYPSINGIQLMAKHKFETTGKINCKHIS